MATTSVNTLKNAPGAISKMAAQMLEDKVQFSKTIDMEPSTSWRGRDGYDTGDTIQISKPARFTVGTNANVTSAIQDVVEEKVSLALNIRKVVAIELTSAEIATDLALASWTKRILDPAVSAIAQSIESENLTRAINATYNSVGTAGSTVFDMDTILAAGQKIDEFACPDKANRKVLLNPAAQRSAVNANKGLFQSSEKIGDQYLDGVMGRGMGFDFLSNNLLPTVTYGVDVAGMAVEASVVPIANGMTTLGVDGVTSGATIKAGSVFTLAGVNAVHPITKVDLGYLQQFVVTADVTETSGNSVTLAISPAIYYTANSLQNVTAAPVDETSTLTFVGAASTGYVQNIAYHKSAFRMCSVPLVLPDGTDMAAQSTSDGGFTIRVIRDYTVLTDKLVMRLDFLGGFAAVRPEWAARITA
jgi:flavin-binding protein dodecin